MSKRVKKCVRELRLHVDFSGRVWYGHGQTVDASDLPPEKFAATSLVTTAGKIMVLGTHANAQLIRAVYMQRKADTPSRKFVIASPRVSPGLREPEVVFSCMATNSWPSSVGGWRAVTSHDFVIYSLIAEINKSNGTLTKSAELYLKQHPAWPAISFVHKQQTEPACRLLVEITDPRWHVDVDEPDRYGQLRTYLGFGNTIKAAARNVSSSVALLRGHDGVCPPCDDVQLHRTMLTVASWYGGFVAKTGPKELKQYLREPRAFLLRYLHDPKADDDLDVRFVRASHRFLRFLKMVWLDNLYPSRRYRTTAQTLGRKCPERVSRRKMLCPKGYERQLFVPEHFFAEMDEVEAWRDHNKKLARSRK